MGEPHAESITSESLARERCAELRAGIPPLTAEEARLFAGAIAREWRVDGAEIRREFTFKTFNAAFGLATRIALLAEAQNHHPELDVAWGRLVVRLTTHSVGGLSAPEFNVSSAVVTVSQCDATLTPVQVTQFSVASATGDPALDLWHVFDFSLTVGGTLSITPVQTFLTGFASTVL